MRMWHLPVSGTDSGAAGTESRCTTLVLSVPETLAHTQLLELPGDHWGGGGARSHVIWSTGRKDQGITTYRMPGPHWSSGQCRSSPGAPWFLKLPPSCEFPTSRVWDYSGKTVSPEWWWGGVCSSPTAASGSGCPRHRKSSSYGNTHHSRSSCHLQLQDGRAIAGVDPVQPYRPSPNHLLDTYTVSVNAGEEGRDDRPWESVHGVGKLSELHLVG